MMDLLWLLIGLKLSALAFIFGLGQPDRWAAHGKGVWPVWWVPRWRRKKNLVAELCFQGLAACHVRSLRCHLRELLMMAVVLLLLILGCPLVWECGELTTSPFMKCAPPKFCSIWRAIRIYLFVYESSASDSPICHHPKSRYERIPANAGWMSESHQTSLC